MSSEYKNNKEFLKQEMGNGRFETQIPVGKYKEKLSYMLHTTHSKQGNTKT